MASRTTPRAFLLRLPLSEAGLLALLLATNLTALATDIVISALYPSLALRYRVPIETVVLLTTPRSLVQLGVLALGPLSDRVGRALLLVGGLGLLAAGAWGAALARNLGAMAAVQVALGLGIVITQAGIPALIGDRYAYGMRGQALAVIRLAMPLSLIVVGPALVALAARAGVAAPFVAFGSAATLLTLLAAWRLPQAAGHPRPAAAASTSSPRRWARPRIVAMLLLVLCLSMVPTAVFSFLAAWIGSTFGDPGRTVGLALTSDGLGALSGIALGALLVDRLGKRRAGILSLALSGGFALVLGSAGRSLPLALGAVAGYSGSLELAFISLAALLSEWVPEARGTVMGFWAAALAVGSAVSPLLARQLWHRGGMAAIGVGGGLLLLGVAAASALVAQEPGLVRRGPGD